MHSFILNPESSSSQNEGDLLVAVATLVTEGRVPGPSKKNNRQFKDFHEGPHCNLVLGKEESHVCNVEDPLCVKFRKNREAILRSLKKGVSLCIEVLFACKELDAVTLENAVLLEQWYFCVSPNRTGTSAPPFNVNQLISAIRSQLYFSQITAWLVKQDKSDPITSDNLQYRLSSPEELLAPITFSLTASKHEFPPSDLGNGTVLSVSFLSAPRLSSKPTFACASCPSKQLTDVKMAKLLDDRMHTNCTVKGKHCCEDMDDNDSLKVESNGPKERTAKKAKANHNALSELDSSNFQKQIEEAKLDFERHSWPHDRCHNLNDLKTVQDKGQILLDAIERSGRNVPKKKKKNWPKSSECDNFCDMSESDKLISRKDGNEFNISYVARHCDSPIPIRPRKKSNINHNNNNISRPTGARKKITFGEDEEEEEEEELKGHGGSKARDIPLLHEEAKIGRRNLGSTTSSVFHTRTGLPLSSSPAPVRKGQTRFDFDSSLNSVSAIKSALFSNSFSTDDESESEGSIVSPCSPELFTGPKRKLGPVIYRRKGRPTGLLGSFEESVLNGRLEPVSTVHGFTAELGASGSFVPKHIFVPVTAFFYAFGDQDKVSTPYLGHISLGKKGYNVPKVGTVQVTLFNPLGTVVKMFVLPYDLSDMPPNSQTFIRQRTLYMPADCKNLIPKWLRFLIHVRFMSSKSGKIYLHSDIRMIIMRKSDMDTATAHDLDINYELRSFIHTPTNPRFSPRK